MKKVIAALFICMFVIPANASIYTLEYVDYQAAFDWVKDDIPKICSDDGKQVIVCNCATGRFAQPFGGAIQVECQYNGYMTSYGCKYSGGPISSDAYCVDTLGQPDTCRICNCKGTELNSGDWKDMGNYRVSRTVYSENLGTSRYICAEEVASVEYGCAENYYKYAGDGASMTCRECPNGGKNDIGTTDASTCKLPGSNTMTDDFGTYTCSSDYIYK